MTTTPKEEVVRAQLLAKINALPRIDYDAYRAEITKLTENELTVIFADWRLYRRAFCWIIEKTPDGGVRPVRFHPKRWQLKYEDTRTNNDIFLKLRKTGCSTDILMEMYSKACIYHHQKSAMMSHEEEASKRLLEILRTAHEYNPVAPPLSKSNTQGVEIEYTRSRIWIGTAGARVFGRGDDLTMLHLSEAAHFDKTKIDASNFMAGLSEAVSKGGRMVMESTPNGEDPIFWQHWQASKNGELWNGIFLSVFDDENTDWGAEHPLVLPSTKNDEFTLTNYEQRLLTSRGGTMGHIRFLRYEKQKMLAKSLIDPGTTAVVGDEQMLLQEYPVDDETCFLTSQDAVFDPGIVNIYRQSAKPPIWVERDGGLRIWERPVSGHAYVGFLDTSEGLPTSHWQALAILDTKSLKYVVTLRIRIDLAELGRITYDLCERYNEALLMVERNNHGHAVLNILDTMGYPNLYYHREIGNALRAGEQRLGWPTRWADTKPMMVQTFKELFEAGAIEVHDMDVLREAAQYRYIDPRTRNGNQTRGRYAPPSGGSDDLLDAHMGCLMGREFATSGKRAAVGHYGMSKTMGFV